jgi:uncharacterized protein YkwD
MRWRRFVATPLGTALALTSITTLAPGAFAASASSPARAGSVAASGNDSEQPATALAPPQPPGPLPSVDELEAQMLSMVNAERAAAGVGPVQQVAWAHSVARQHAQDMAAAGDIWHNIAGYINRGRGAMGATFLGENVAMDSTLAADDALLYAHIPHRVITLDGRFNSVGIGIALDSHNWVYVTEDFAQIPGGASRSATAAPAAPAAKAPVATAPVAKIPVAAAIRPQVAAPARAAVAAVAAPPAPAPAPAVAAPAAPAAQPITTNPASPSLANGRSNSGSNSVVESASKSDSHSHHDSSGIWILLGVAGALMTAFWGRRFVVALAHPRTQPPVTIASGPEGSTATNNSPWRQAA